ncbi:MAG: hypothetical protein P0Y48_02850 [Candidatus Microbacterium phytovorans]|uniref:Uncharacterized protein n=1 Tax=Candidatus Microbacterium phytovorans TaxID=3121374 RepID=A0AAJ6B5T8_9MICO|nr:hypothetical protein [Microbacterium sp.]WEK14166.1 MAG: hypothetical protein P0Y48_02850 [Microbacterium sp.]
MSDEYDTNPFADQTSRDAAPPADQGGSVQYGVGPFTIREVSLLGVWLLAFIVSFFSIWVDGPGSAALLDLGSVWSSGIDWVLTIGVPTVAVFLIVLRRFSPDGIRRVGSLAVDQFASVAFSVSAVVWLGVLWTNVARGIQTGLWLSSWVVWVEFFLMVAGVFLTVLAPFIRPFDEDFLRGEQVLAHRNARPVRPVTPRPSTPRPRPAAAAPEASPYDEAPEPTYAPRAADPVGDPSNVDAASDDATAAFPFVVEEEPAAAAPAASQAFWALSPVERDVVDENGFPLFTVGPTAWALVIEDRGDRFVIRHEDGRVGYLTDVSGVTRG